MKGVRIQTSEYRVSRSELALLASGEYLRNFWWFVLVTPLFGVLAFVFTSGLLQVIGLMAILWPFSIPARAVLSTSKSARLFRSCYMKADEDAVTFYGSETQPKQLRFQVPLAAIRSVRETRDFVILQTRRYGFAPIRVNAFSSEDDRLSFTSWVSMARNVD